LAPTVSCRGVGTGALKLARQTACIISRRAMAFISNFSLIELFLMWSKQAGNPYNRVEA